MHNYKELDVWKRAISLAEKVYSLSSQFPSDERFGLTSQIRRSVISVPSNIAEGAGRNSKGEFNQFLGFSLGSLFELETQLILAQKFQYVVSVSEECEEIDSLRKMIHGLQKSFNLKAR